MKKRLLALGLVLALSMFLSPGKSEAFLNNWLLDTDGAGGAAATLISEYLDIVGPAYVINTLSGNSGTFQEWGAFVTTGHDGGAPYPGTAQVTALFTAGGNITLAAPLGTLQFTSGTLTIYSDAAFDFTTTNAIYGANNGTPIATLSLVSGSGAVDPTGVPNGLITTTWNYTSLAPGYWFGPGGAPDLSTLPPVTLVLGFSTTNASYVADPAANVVSEIANQFAGVIGTPPNTPPGDLFVSANGQWRLLTVPEPASMLLLGSGLVGLAALARRRMKK